MSDYLLTLAAARIEKEFNAMGYEAKPIVEALVIKDKRQRYVLDNDVALLCNKVITDPHVSIYLSSPDNFFITSQVSYNLLALSSVQRFSQYIDIVLSDKPLSEFSLEFLRFKPIKR